MHSSSLQAGMMRANCGWGDCSGRCTILRDEMLFASRGIRRHAQDELAFRHLHAAYTGFDSKLHQVAHVRQLFGTKINPLPGSNGTKEFHAPDRGKKKHGLRVFGVARRRGNTGRLRESFCQDDARNERITRKMTGEDRIVRGK